MTDELKTLQNVVDQCSTISGNNERCSMFQKTAEPIKALIAQIYDPFQKFHVTSANIIKFEKAKTHKTPVLSAEESPTTLSELLHMLSEGKISGHTALQTCLHFINLYKTYRDVILKAINKDLKIRVGVQMVNKAFPFLVPVFSCALSHPLEKHLKFYEKNKKDWMISRKLDGCRCIFICENGKVVAYSRSGHVYPAHIEGLDYFLKKFQHVNGVLDGEMGVIDDSEKEYFNIANSIMNPNATRERSKKNLQMKPYQYLCYFVFDFIPLDTFKKGEGPPVWSDRQEHLKKEMIKIADHKDTYLKQVTKQIRILPQEPASKMEKMWEEVETKGQEGLMLRLPSANYEGKKTRNMLKRKMQDDEEFVIEEATASLQMPPNSTEPVLALEHVGISYKGHRVFIGSGLTFEEKIEYGKNPKQLIGKTITVKHYGESRDKNSGYSLRHPTIKQLWLDKKGRTH
jgi:hypothetical protein